MSAAFEISYQSFDFTNNTERGKAVRAGSYSKFSCLRNREIETETLIFAPISLSYIEID